MTIGASNTESFRSVQPPIEGSKTREIEKRTSLVPSGAYLAGAIAAMVGSAALMTFERSRARAARDGSGGLANFVGQWAPTLLIIGLYNKIVKLERELVG